MIQYHKAEDLDGEVKEIIEKLNLNHIDPLRVVCIKSKGSQSRNILARCHTLSRIIQKALEIKAHYIIELISEKFDKLSEEEKTKTLIHELCLPDKEYIIIESENGLEITKIGDLIEREFKKAKKINKSDNIEWIIPSKTYKAISYNIKDEIVEMNKITKLTRRLNTEKKIVEIITRDGRKIEASQTHPVLFTKNPHSYNHPKRKRIHTKMIGAKDILNQKGIPRLLEIFALPKLNKEICEIDLTDLLKNKNISNKLIIKRGQMIRVQKGATSIRVPTKFILDNELGLFFGFYLSEGSIDHKSGAVSFSFDKMEDKYHNLIKKVLKERFGAKPKERIPHGNCKIVYAYSRLLQEIISNVFGFGEKAHHKKIPSFVYYAPIEFISGLVDGWFAGDGCVLFNKKIKAVTLSAFSRSQELIFGMLLLLARLKVIGRLRRNQHDILIQSFFVPKFFQYCKKLIEYKNMEDNVNSIRRMKHENQFKFLKYIRVRSVKIKKYKGKYFYNLEVQPDNNFMHASGIFTHNCHIPKSFGGGFRHHRPYVNRRTVDRMYKKLNEF